MTSSTSRGFTPEEDHTDEKTFNRDRRVTDADPSLQASMSRVGGWAYSVSPYPDRSPSTSPTGTLAPQCASLVLGLVVEETSARLRRQQVNCNSCPLRS